MKGGLLPRTDASCRDEQVPIAPRWSLITGRIIAGSLIMISLTVLIAYGSLALRGYMLLPPEPVRWPGVFSSQMLTNRSNFFSVSCIAGPDCTEN